MVRMNSGFTTWVDIICLKSVNFIAVVNKTFAVYLIAVVVGCAVIAAHRRSS